MDPGELKPDYLSKEQIWEIVEDFRQRCIRNEDTPVDIEAVIQSNLGIDVIPVNDIQSSLGMEGFISLDFKNIYVDNRLYSADIYYPRVRFTLAHEIGHYVLHRSFIDQLRFGSIRDWMEYRQSLNEDSLGWFEYQANEFAGRLLVPIDKLIVHFRAEREKNAGFSPRDPAFDELIDVAAMSICSEFGVSKDVISIRLQKEKIKAVLGLE